jgi:hypothetical protein
MTSPEQTSANAIIRDYLRQWGLLELAPDLDRLIREGLGADAITLQLRDTQAYKRRFQANDLREAAGLPVLSPAEYIAAEDAYRQILRTYGLPSSFYDQPDDFHGFLARDIAPEEVNARAQAAQQTWLTTDQAVRDTWRDFYGLTDGAAIASILDPDKALPIVQRMVTASRIGAEASRNGLGADRSRFEQYADRGVSVDQAAQGFAEIGQTLTTDQAIARRFGQTFTQAEAEAARITGTASAQRKQRELAQSEQALFDGRATADRSSLSRRTSGSY